MTDLIQSAAKIGAIGTDDYGPEFIDRERQAFEAWVKAHEAWAKAHSTAIRMMWAAWRDRAALAIPSCHAATQGWDIEWIPLTERMPNPDEHPRVLIYTQGFDFDGEQVFDVRTDTLNECAYETPDEQPTVCKRATHWRKHPDL